MRKIILPFILISQGLFAQLNNFTLDEGNIYWQKVFNSNEKNLKQYFIESGLFKDIREDSFKISGNLNYFDIDYKGAGYSEMITTIYLARSHFSGFVVLEFKDGRYRVIVKNINLTQSYTDPINRQGEESSLEDYATKRNRSIFTPLFIRKDSGIIDYTLNKLFGIKGIPSSDW